MSRVLTQEEIDALRASGPYVPAPVERYRVVVEAGCAELRPEEIAAIRPGALIALDRAVGDPVTLVANATVVAYGVLAAQGDRVAVRVTALHDPDRIAKGGTR
jgi:flagellar motor switch protein FliM